VDSPISGAARTLLDDMGNCLGIGTHSKQCVDLRGWRRQALYGPTNAWLVMKPIKPKGGRSGTGAYIGAKDGG